MAHFAAELRGKVEQILKLLFTAHAAAAGCIAFKQDLSMSVPCASYGVLLWL